MEHFENIVRLLLEKEGYWVLSSHKVCLSKAEKAKTGKPSIPRPEIDLLAYRPKGAELIALEVKSYFDSGGVRFEELSKQFPIATGRYKLFTCDSYRDIVFSRLKQELLERGLLTEDIPISLGLAAGNVKSGDESKIQKLMDSNKWFYWSPQNIKQRVISLSKTEYENEAAYIVSKILLR